MDSENSPILVWGVGKSFYYLSKPHAALRIGSLIPKPFVVILKEGLYWDRDFASAWGIPSWGVKEVLSGN